MPAIIVMEKSGIVGFDPHNSCVGSIYGYGCLFFGIPPAVILGPY